MLSRLGHIPEVNQVVPNTLNQPGILVGKSLEEADARPDKVELKGRVLVVELNRFGVDLLRSQAL